MDSCFINDERISALWHIGARSLNFFEHTTPGSEVAFKYLLPYAHPLLPFREPILISLLVILHASVRHFRANGNADASAAYAVMGV